ncbi:DNA-directed RNA polymerases I and III subunit RPAC1-like isoform X2 [Macrosteles quadrilineatus]|uniref:DNA-directed RNA polymerases I and III subunit RPAC1-like isoform X2 n=1 Tax=Macrosteles quadrilineatus TaxID=74068 RepID=UPI0023E2BDC8|nr:DNA-directed RNA polymerases I and III subunit RPAC1-like isoform X2 [Macrosteles quadrilineatus]
MDSQYVLREHNISKDKPLQINIVRYDDRELEFDLIGVHTSLANAFRRILLSEVPSMAIEKVLIYNNTSLLQDEVLAHRLGLIPLKADCRLFEYKPEVDAEPTDQDTLKFELKIKCTRNANSGKDSTRVDDLYQNHNVYSKHIKWIPVGSQNDLFKNVDVGPVHDDILIAKMRPGHEINLQMLAVKGIGKDHAKFSPVATASYRLLPTLQLTQEVEGELALKLQSCFSPGVISVVEDQKGRKFAKVDNPRYDTCSRNVFRFNDLKDSVVMGREGDHFIFTVESVGALKPDELFLEAVKVLKNKCRVLLQQIDNVMTE